MCEQSLPSSLTLNNMSMFCVNTATKMGTALFIYLSQKKIIKYKYKDQALFYYLKLLH